jgi:dUTP pyrophosphatase
MSVETISNLRPILNIKIVSDDEEVIKYYQTAAKKTHSADYQASGFDLILTSAISGKSTDDITTGKMLPLGIAASPTFAAGYDLRARSSICKTKLRLANGIGTIDQDYRGEIMAAVDVIGDYDLPKCTRLFQLCHPSLVPMIINIVDTLDPTTRGSGGFGSTGN